MTTDRQLASNRKNAQKSTGPRSEKGKRRSRNNALRHGLAIAIGSDPHFNASVERLSAALAGDKEGQLVGDFARQLAETQVDLWRLRKVRAARLEEIFSEKDFARDCGFDRELHKLERYEQRIYGRRKRVFRALLALNPR